jgi:phage protein D/phage baseplate assembly protein gpV
MSVATVTVSSEGQTMDAGYQLLSVDIVREVNRIPQAELTLIDGDVAKRTFTVSDSGFFDPGKEVEIKLRYEGEPGSEKTVFSGLVVAHGVEAEHERSVLTVALKDKAVKLTQVPKSMVFTDVHDDEVVKKLLQAQGLKAGKIEATKATHKEIIQYACTDWDFIVSRADVNGLLVCVTDGTVDLGRIELVGSPKKSLELGIDEIFGIEIEANADGQFGEVESLAWDVKNQQMTASAKAKSASLAPGDFDGKKLAGALGGDKRVLTDPAPALPEELQAWADATLARSRLGLVRGRISVPGCADLALLDVIEIKGVGKHFNGQALVTGWRHRVTDQGWITDIRFGLGAEWFADRPDVAARPAAGLLPPVGGLQIGLVDSFEADPDKEFRVKVRIPALGDPQPAIWARLASPDAGKGRGFFFLPEPGDEVVLGFFNEDPRQPVIVGALYGSANTPPEGFDAVSEKNNLKGLVTKKGTKIGFDDKDDGKAAVYIETANKNKVLLDDDAEAITLSDQHGNVVTLDKNGVSIKSAKDLLLEASGKVEIKGSAVDVK